MHEFIVNMLIVKQKYIHWSFLLKKISFPAVYLGTNDSESTP